MDFDEDHYPDYRPGYKNYDRMHELLWRESSKITDFAIRKGIKFYPYAGTATFEAFPGYKYDVAATIPTDIITSRQDVYIGIAQIPQQ